MSVSDDGSNMPYMDQRKKMKYAPSDSHKVRVFMLNGLNMGKDDLHYLEQKFPSNERDSEKKKKEMVESWRKAYSEVTKASTESLEDIIQENTRLWIPELSKNKYGSVEDIPPDIQMKEPGLVAKARSKAIRELYDIERTFVCLTPIIANFEDVQLHEIFRAASTYTLDKNVLYKWRCDCQNVVSWQPVAEQVPVVPPPLL